MTRGLRAGRRRQTDVGDDSGLRLEGELAQLREENAHLRIEQQRALSIGRVAEGVRDAVAGIESMPAEHGDEAWAVYTEAAVIRETLVAVCSDLQVAVSQLQRQLVGTTPAPEMDRRATDRRSQPAGEICAGAAHRPGTAAVLTGSPVSASWSPLALRAPSVPGVSRLEEAAVPARRHAATSGAVASDDKPADTLAAPAERRTPDAALLSGYGHRPQAARRPVHPYLAALSQARQ